MLCSWKIKNVSLIIGHKIFKKNLSAWFEARCVMFTSAADVTFASDSVCIMYYSESLIYFSHIKVSQCSEKHYKISVVKRLLQVSKMQF